MLTRFKELVGEIDRVDYELGKQRIFNYDTLDEADPGKERLRTDITVEIGGPGAHIQFSVRTRDEHTAIKDAVMGVLNKRKQRLEYELVCLCEDTINGKSDE